VQFDKIEYVSLLLERSGLNTPTSDSWRNAIQIGGESLGAVMRLIHTVATHTGSATIEDGGVDGIECIFAPEESVRWVRTLTRGSDLPIPIGLISCVSTLIAEGLFERVHEVTMPREEVGLFDD
jgi:hypothetical protein